MIISRTIDMVTPKLFDLYKVLKVLHQADVQSVPSFI